MTQSNLKLSIPAKDVHALDIMDADITEVTLDNFGIHYEQKAMDEFRAYAEDSATAASATPVQFLQHFIPEMIRVVTKARVADRLLGRDIAGAWEDEEVVQPITEGYGVARPYGDKTNHVSSEFNVNFEKRTIQRFEQDVEVGALEEARAAKMNVNAAATKRIAAAESLAIAANDVAFNGYAAGASKTYGILNDANLPNYTAVAQGAAGYTAWSTKTFAEISNDIKTAMSALRVRSGSNFDPYNDECVLGIADAAVDYLATVNEHGLSVTQWIKETYKNCRIESVPQFSGANSAANVLYLFAEKIGESKVLRQNVQDTLRLLGVEKKSKGFIETYSNATAGVLLAQPIGLVRYTGI